MQEVSPIALAMVVATAIIILRIIPQVDFFVSLIVLIVMDCLFLGIRTKEQILYTTATSNLIS